MNVMILGAKPSAGIRPECPSHAELFERLGRIEKCLEEIGKALAAQRKSPDREAKAVRPATPAKTSARTKARAGQ